MLKILNTPTGYLNVRKTPSADGVLLTKVLPGKVFQYLKEENDWYLITSGVGEDGWIFAKYAEKIK